MNEKLESDQKLIPQKSLSRDKIVAQQSAPKALNNASAIAVSSKVNPNPQQKYSKVGGRAAERDLKFKNSAAEKIAAGLLQGKRTQPSVTSVRTSKFQASYRATRSRNNLFGAASLTKNSSPPHHKGNSFAAAAAVANYQRESQTSLKQQICKQKIYNTYGHVQSSQSAQKPSTRGSSTTSKRADSTSLRKSQKPPKTTAASFTQKQPAFKKIDSKALLTKPLKVRIKNSQTVHLPTQVKNSQTVNSDLAMKL